MKNIMLETVCNFVNLWKKRDNQQSEVMGVIQRIERLSNLLDTLSINYIPREANQAAHLSIYTYIKVGGFNTPSAMPRTPLTL
jgi:hypothetical protein